MTLPELYRLFQSCGAVTTDSRNCPQGSMFIALKGESFNGNTFAAKALESGCSYAVVDDPACVVKGDERYVLTDDGLQTLQLLANHHRRSLGTRVIGITGTNGKTTTKELIAAVLSQSNHVLYTQGNLNNHIGVPITLLGLRPEHDLAVVEMGANHPGEIKRLCEIAEPDCGLITNVGKAHLEGFGSFEGVIRAKGELYDFLRTRKDAVLFLHRDNEYLTRMARGLTPITYGSQPELYVSGHMTGNSPYLRFDWKAAEDPAAHTVTTRLIGSYNLPNALAAVAVGRYFGVDSALVDKALAEYTPRNNRSQLCRTAANTLIVDAYNANPTSMMAALENFRGMEASGKFAILGDMRELGADGMAEHRKIVDYLRDCRFERICLVGEQFAAVGGDFETYPNVEALIDELKRRQPKGHTVLIKGSNGMKLNLVIDCL